MLGQALILGVVGLALVAAGSATVDVKVKRITSTHTVARLAGKAAGRAALAGALAFCLASPLSGFVAQISASGDEGKRNANSIESAAQEQLSEAVRQGRIVEAVVVAKLRQVQSLETKSGDELVESGYLACDMLAGGYRGIDVAAAVASTARISERDAAFVLAVVLPALCPHLVK